MVRQPFLSKYCHVAYNGEWRKQKNSTQGMLFLWGGGHFVDFAYFKEQYMKQN